jgi:cell wall-associated NlpC family hydrolase
VVSAQLPAASTAAGCVQTAGGVPAVQAPTQAVAAAISFAEQQLGKPYLWGGTGPDAFDCSGLVMMAYRTAGISIARTTYAQWATETRVPASQVQPGDLVFFAGADGTATDPGHVGLVIGGGKMIEAYATGFPIRVSSYANRGAIGFTEPWAGAPGTTPGTTTSPGATTSPGNPGNTGTPTAPPAGGMPTPGTAITPTSRAPH